MRGINAGGHARVGFENNLHLPNGDIAPNTAALVSSLVDVLQENDCQPASSKFARQLLGACSV
jgi:uncharacterized protein (DUF849 family)